MENPEVRNVMETLLTDNVEIHACLKAKAFASVLTVPESYAGSEFTMISPDNYGRVFATDKKLCLI
jgi:hypothetical protein